ncbi:hypothetical protein [uncultured Enterococcus sp.]|uniref:hypothetical protein n=1 Tax=uncultured Enterococcus sp. TaxID=167972 RepID=UPI0022DC26EF|nr:hypothetical protein [uncultured Enterococcus sp.]CAI3402453.1 hypothetical protein CIRMBP1197_01536 [Enterococcus cecorum]
MKQILQQQLAKRINEELSDESLLEWREHQGYVHYFPVTESIHLELTIDDSSMVEQSHPSNQEIWSIHVYYYDKEESCQSLGMLCYGENWHDYFDICDEVEELLNYIDDENQLKTFMSHCDMSSSFEEWKQQFQNNREVEMI